MIGNDVVSINLATTIATIATILATIATIAAIFATIICRVLKKHVLVQIVPAI